MAKKKGYQFAVDTTVSIARNLKTFSSNKKLYKKTVRSIFDDQLRAHTSLNRVSRHRLLKELTDELKKVMQ